jgi:hypothetical protein
MAKKRKEVRKVKGVGNFEREKEAGKSTVLYCSVLYGAPDGCVYVYVCVCGLAVW